MNEEAVQDTTRLLKNSGSREATAELGAALPGSSICSRCFDQGLVGGELRFHPRQAFVNVVFFVFVYAELKMGLVNSLIQASPLIRSL